MEEYEEAKNKQPQKCIFFLLSDNHFQALKEAIERMDPLIPTRLLTAIIFLDVD